MFEGMVESLSGLILFVKLLIQLAKEILHMSGKSQGISETSGCGNLTCDQAVLIPFLF